MTMANPTARANYEPNSWEPGIGGPREDRVRGFETFPDPQPGPKRRLRAESFADHYSQARQFYVSQTAVEQHHIIEAFVFELSKCDELRIRARMVAGLRNVDDDVAMLLVLVARRYVRRQQRPPASFVLIGLGLLVGALGALVDAAERLEDVATGEEHPHQQPGAPARRGQRAQLPPEHERHDQRRGDEAVGEESHRGKQRDRVLHHDEGQPPYRGDADQAELRQTAEPPFAKPRARPAAQGRHLLGHAASAEASARAAARRRFPSGHIRLSGQSEQRGVRATQVRRPCRISSTCVS